MNPFTSAESNGARGARLAAMLVLAVLAAFAAFIVLRWQRVQRLSGEIERRLAERRVLRLVEPQLSAVQSRRIEQDLLALETKAAESERPWQATAAAPQLDPFLEIAAFVAESRERLQRQGIVLAADERLGFQDCLERPPSESEWHALRQELVLVTVAIDALSRSGATELVALRRGRTAHGEPNPRTSAAARSRPKQVPLARVELQFAGDTAALARFVNTLHETRPCAWIEALSAERGLADAAGPVARFTCRLVRPAWETTQGPEGRP